MPTMVKIKRKAVSKPKRNLAKPKRKPQVASNQTNPKQKLSPKENDYSSMSVDDFLNNDFNSSDDESASNSIENDQTSDAEEIIEDLFQNNNPSEDNHDDAASEHSEEDGDEIEVHKKSLEKLKQTDPEFYQFLQDNDQKLLNFQVSDSEDEDEPKPADDEEQTHKPSADLEVASDESDFEGDDQQESVKDDRVITLKMLKQWREEVQTDKSNKSINCLVHAFHAALKRVSNSEDDEDEPMKYKVDGSSVFNGVIQVCVLELGPAVRRFLKLQPGSKQPPHKCKRFPKVKTLLRLYFTDLLKLLGGVTSTNILTVLLKHLHYMSSLIVSFPHQTKSLLRRLVHLWGTSDESVRVLAFLCILRVTTNQQAVLLDSVLKMMYLTYVKNSKFVSNSALPGINFMRRSLVEMLALDPGTAYQHVFLYVRQLAIHLRNAIVVNKKENVQTVYNWQFVNSLRLWQNLLSVTCNKPQLQPLIYPFVQVCLGTLKLVPTAQYFPLRLHVTQILIELSKDTGIFVPVLPFLLEILTTYDFNKKHQKVSMKPLHFTSLLRLSKSQLSENGFKDTTIETVYGQLLEYLASQSHTIAFPDLSLFCVLQLKQFAKKCSVANYTRKMKQLLEKIEQNSKFVETERKKVAFNLTDLKQIEGWESQIRTMGTPLQGFYENWNKLRVIRKNKEVTKNDEVGEYNLPVVKKRKGAEKKEESGPVELFPSDSESEVGDNEGVKKKRGKRGGKNVNKKVTDHSGPVEDGGEGDVVQDLKLSDW